MTLAINRLFIPSFWVLAFVSLIVFGCSKKASKYCSTDKIVHISRYKLGDVGCCKAVLLNSTGLNYYLCYYSDDINDTLKRISVDDGNIYNFLIGIDTSSINDFKKCNENSHKPASGYGYTITIISNNKNRSYFLGEILNSNCAGNFSDSLNFYFNRMEDKVPFWK